MLNFSIRNILVTLAIALGTALAGLWAWQRVPVDAIPDLSDNQVVVWAEWPGKSPEDVQIQVTQRLTLGLQGLAGVQSVRGTSLYGAAYAYVIFAENRDFYDCRTRVLERLASLQAQLPDGVIPSLGPDATAMGQVFAFTLQGPRSLEERRRVIDQIVVPALESVAGVAEVAPAGGVVREYHIDVDPVRLEEQALTIDALVMAIRASGRDVGAMSIERSAIETMIRGVGFVRSVGDVERIVVRGEPDKGTGLLLGDVADVSIGGAVRQGILADEHGEHAGAIVAMRVGEDPKSVILAVKRRLMDLRPALKAEDLMAVPFYDRSQLITETSDTLTDTLSQELIIAMLVVIVFLLHVRASLAVGLTLPLGVLATFIVMWLFGVSANLMSLAGIAIAVGELVDLGIVVTENIVQHLTALKRRLRDAGEPAATSPWDERVIEAVQNGVREVAPAILTATATTVVGFLPVFALDEQAGRLFGPMALTKTLAITGSALFGLLLVPLLCRLLLPEWKLPKPWRYALAGLIGGLAFCFFLGGIPLPVDHGRWSVVLPGWIVAPAMGAFAAWLAWRFGGEQVVEFDENPVSRAIGRAYRAILTTLLAHKRIFLGTCLGIIVLGFGLGLGWPRLAAPLRSATAAAGGDLTTTAPDRWLSERLPGIGESFLPPLDEGSLLFMPSILSQGGLGESLRVMSEQNRRIAEVPEVLSLMGKMGRAETALDPAPIGMVETVVLLKPYRDWPLHDVLMPDGSTERRPRTLVELRSALAAASDIPGVAPSWLQPIETRIVMLSTGIKSLIALQVSGDDSESLERFIEAAEKIVIGTPGAADVTAQREGGKPYAEVRLDSARLARFGLTADAVMMAVETALGGMPVSWSVEANQRYGIRLRYLRERRDDPDELALLQVPVMAGGHGAIPLSSLVAPPRVYTIAFTATDPVAFRAALPLPIARGLTPIAADRAELVLPAGHPLPAGIAPEGTAGAVRVVSEHDHPDAMTWTVGPMQIRSENGKRVAYVLLNPRGRGEIDVVKDADQRIRAALAAGTLTMPKGATYRWVGRYEQKQHADRILTIVIAISLSLMIVLIYIGTRRWATTSFIVLGNLPLTVAGGLLGVWLWGAEMTTAVTVGFIVLLGVMFNDGILIGVYLDERFKDLAGRAALSIADVRQRVLEAGLRRIRPALMTNATTIIALAPILWADGRGAEIMIPMALPSIGGMVVDLLTLFMVPVLYSWWQERRVKRAQLPAN
jgi:Cu(I)/Ag(I) efflux system membrane protein CusA/SilA